MTALPDPWHSLEWGRPRQTLQHWRAELQADDGTIERHLEAAVAGLPRDPLARLRREALTLLRQLAASEPGETEIQGLGGLLRGWGTLCLGHAPGRALQHFERAWACGPDPALEQQLADLYARQGMASGAHALAAPATDQPPWPQLTCAGLHCNPCQSRLAETPQPQLEPDLELKELRHGRIWLERHPHLHETHGLAVASADGTLLPELCRRYPWQWQDCPHEGQRQNDNLAQLAWSGAGSPPWRLDGPVLAVADLSAELYYHGHLELLPRLGRAWQHLQAQLPQLRLWHNGGSAPWLSEALARLGIPPDRLISAQQHPHLQASQLLVPSHPSPFGSPGERGLSWLRAFWLQPAAADPAPAPQRVLFSRPPNQRRPLLQHSAWRQTLAAQGFAEPAPSAPLARQLQKLQSCEQLVAAHGGAMANLLALPAGSDVLELANPAYAPPYFASLLASGRLRHRRLSGGPTPPLLQQLLYAGPLEWPIDLPPP
jgi:hypothetical protein